MRLLIFFAGIIFSTCISFFDVSFGYSVLTAMTAIQLLVLSRRKKNIFLIIHYTTVLIYFSLAPAIQLMTGVEFWDLGNVSHDSHRLALLLLNIYLTGIEFGTVVNISSKKYTTEFVSEIKFNSINLFYILILSVVAFSILFISPELTFVPRGLFDLANSRPLELIVFSTLPKTLLLLASIVSIEYFLKRKSFINAICSFFILTISAIGSNPVNTARQIIIIGVLPIIIFYFGSRRRWLLVVLLFGAIAGVGPVLNFISRGSFYDIDVVLYPFSPDFDAMYIVAGVIDRVTFDYLGYGRYLISAFSFFLPRELKLFPNFDPLSTNQVEQNFSQNNLSFPPFMTAYLDFQIFGPFFLGVLVAIFFKKMEKQSNSMSFSNTRALIFYVLVAAYVPFLRGPILGWGPFAIGGVLSAFLIGYLNRK